ncbi:MAG: hypothetical protein EXR50_06415 [Dehalococcoidia bacterium]|nr:hypothetical protein [Dehalococcoidia bacterium]
MYTYDLHVHTLKGSPDSELTPSQIKNTAEKVGLYGACITEHDKTWDHVDLRIEREQNDYNFIRAMEVTTDLGHVLVYGLNTYISGIHKAENLRKAVDAAGGVMIIAHPFRRVFHFPKPYGNGKYDAAIEELASWPIFELVDEIEVLNGATGELENFLAYEVAKYLGKKGTAGSDAHSVHGLGRSVTIFENAVQDVGDFVKEIKAGSIYPAQVFTGPEMEREIVPYSRGVLAKDLKERTKIAMGVDG